MSEFVRDKIGQFEQMSKEIYECSYIAPIACQKSMVEMVCIGVGDLGLLSLIWVEMSDLVSHDVDDLDPRQGYRVLCLN